MTKEKFSVTFLKPDKQENSAFSRKIINKNLEYVLVRTVFFSMRT